MPRLTEMFTGFLIAMLVVAGVGTLVGGSIAFAKQRKALASQTGAKQLTDGNGANLLERTIKDLRVGDVLQYGSKDWLVEGVVEYDEDGHQWLAGHMMDGKDNRWIIVGMERLGPMKIRLVEVDSESDLDAYPPEIMISGGVRHNLQRRGTASARFVGEIGRLIGALKKSGATVERCRWWRYEGPGDETLIVEQWGGEYRVLRGTRLVDGMVELIPGS